MEKCEPVLSTLETISKIEDAMGFSIMFSPYFVSDADSFHSVAEEPEEYDIGCT